MIVFVAVRVWKGLASDSEVFTTEDAASKQVGKWRSEDWNEEYDDADVYEREVREG